MQFSCSFFFEIQTDTFVNGKVTEDSEQCKDGTMQLQMSKLQLSLQQAPDNTESRGFDQIWLKSLLCHDQKLMVLNLPLKFYRLNVIN